MRVSLQATARIAERALLPGQLPDEESFVARSAHDHVVDLDRRAETWNILFEYEPVRDARDEDK
jgi:hypothetical protein